MRLSVSVSIRRPTGFSLQAELDCETGALGLVGPSGSGKSTLLEAIAGIEPGARVVLDGRDCSRLPLERRQIGYVSQDALLFPHLTVNQNLTYSPSAEDPGSIARALGLGPLLGRMPRNLSGGERRRVALGRAILARPRLLLLDEPFAGLDETLRREAMAHLDRVRREFRIPIVLVSHLSDEVAGLTDWAVRLDAGRIVHRGPSVSLLGVPGARIDNAFTATVIGPGRVRSGALELEVVLPEGAAGEVLLAAYAHEITLADPAPAGISARNIFPVRIARVTPAAGAVLVELESPAFRVLVTDQARESLDLRPGTSKMALLKATSIAYLGPA